MTLKVHRKRPFHEVTGLADTTLELLRALKAVPNGSAAVTTPQNEQMDLSYKYYIKNASDIIEIT